MKDKTKITVKEYRKGKETYFSVVIGQGLDILILDCLSEKKAGDLAKAIFELIKANTNEDIIITEERITQ